MLTIRADKQDDTMEIRINRDVAMTEKVIGGIAKSSMSTFAETVTRLKAGQLSSGNLAYAIDANAISEEKWVCVWEMEIEQSYRSLERYIEVKGLSGLQVVRFDGKNHIRVFVPKGMEYRFCYANGMQPTIRGEWETAA